MDKSRLRTSLIDVIRANLPNFERSARVTCLLSVRLDGSEDSAVFLDIVEELSPSRAAQPAAEAVAAMATTTAAASKAEKSSKRKSQAPQKMIANGLDSFVTAAVTSAAAATTATTPSAVGSIPTSAAALSASTTVKKETGGGSGGGGGWVGFHLNNPGFQQHFLLPTGFLTTSVFPTPTAVFQPQPQASAVAAHPDLLKATTARPEVGSSHQKNIDFTHQQQQQQQQQQLLQQEEALQPSTLSGSKSRSLFGLRSRRGGHRTFPCNQCQEAFVSLASLSKHTYTMHKSYKCTFCSASFTQRSNLQRHSLKHVGFKPFACRCCQKSYYRKDHLVRHIEVTHPGNEPKRNIETKLTSSECLEYLERKFESGEYSIAIEADGEGDGDEEMPDEEELEEAEGAEISGPALGGASADVIDVGDGDVAMSSTTTAAADGVREPDSSAVDQLAPAAETVAEQTEQADTAADQAAGTVADAVLAVEVNSESAQPISDEQSSELKQEQREEMEGIQQQQQFAQPQAPQRRMRHQKRQEPAADVLTVGAAAVPLPAVSAVAAAASAGTNA